MSEHPFSQFIQAFSTPSLFHIWSWALCRYPAKLWTGFSAAWAEPAVRDLTPTMLWQHITLTLIHLCWLLLKWNISFECPFALSTFFLIYIPFCTCQTSHTHTTSVAPPDGGLLITSHWSLQTMWDTAFVVAEFFAVLAHLGWCFSPFLLPQ